MGDPTEVRNEPKVGLVCNDPASAEMVIRSLKGIADVPKLHEPPLDVLSKLDGLIIWFSDPLDPLIKFFARCTKQVPLLPILGMSNFEMPIVIELLKCGMADHMAPPVDVELLKRKLQRMLAKVSVTVVDIPLLAALPQLADEARAQTKRSCARAPVTAQFPATATVILNGGPGPKVEIRDIAILTDNQPGGLCVFADPVAAKKLPVQNWLPNTMVPLHLNFPEEISKTPIRTRARVIRVMPPNALKPGVMVAFQYWLDRLQDEPIVQRFWMRCQQIESRKMRKVD